jgi:nucleotide-binding universal stress UspA family protein
MTDASRVSPARLGSGESSGEEQAGTNNEVWWQGFNLQVTHRSPWLEALLLGSPLQWELLRIQEPSLVIRPEQKMPEALCSILVGLEDTEAGWQVFEIALELAQHTRATLNGVCTVDTSWVRGTQIGPYYYPGRVEAALQEGYRLLRHAGAASLGTGVRFRGRLVEGRLAATLLQMARKDQAYQLMAVGLEGKSWVGRLVQGGWVRHIVRWSTIPVLVAGSNALEP